jgi:transposase
MSVCGPYLTLMNEDAPQRDYPLREVFNGLRHIVRGGIPWRMMPNPGKPGPPWYTVYQRTQRWLQAGVFETMVHDLRALLHLAAGRKAQPTAAIFDSRTLQSTPESGEHAGYDGAKRRKGSKTVLKSDSWHRRFKRQRVKRWKLPLSIRAIPAKMRRRPLKNWGYGWRWLSCPKPKKGSCCCRDGGLSNAVLAGWPVSAVWHAILNACLTP